MIWLARKLASKVWLYLLKRDQYRSERLRAHFRKRHDIDVGLYSYGCFDQWRMPGPMRVGRYCSIASTVRSAVQNHPLHHLTTHPFLYEARFGLVERDMMPEAPLVIEDDVWIGDHVMILPACKRIGRGAVVGAGAVVTRDVEPYTIVAGNPARALRPRFPAETQQALERSRWWELDIDALGELVRTNPDMVFGPTAERLAAWRGFRPPKD